MFTETNEQHFKQFKSDLVTVMVWYMFYKMGIREILEGFELFKCDIAEVYLNRFLIFVKSLTQKLFNKFFNGIVLLIFN